MMKKREGDTRICRQCGADLICRVSEYRRTRENKLQWQNQDGTPHYKYIDGVFTCTGKEHELKHVKKAPKKQIFSTGTKFSWN